MGESMLKNGVVETLNKHWNLGIESVQKALGDLHVE